jgi:hypothetical protein
MQIAFNFLLQFVAPFLRIGGRFLGIVAAAVGWGE